VELAGRRAEIVLRMGGYRGLEEMLQDCVGIDEGDRIGRAAAGESQIKRSCRIFDALGGTC
jgi:hypothetical protein